MFLIIFSNFGKGPPDGFFVDFGQFAGNAGLAVRAEINGVFLEGFQDAVRRFIKDHGTIGFGKGFAEQARGLGEVIVFTGHRSDMREIYAVSTLVLSLSAQPESFGRTVLEALSLGTPVLGYARGGVGEILTRLYPAGLIPSGDRAALLERTLSLLRMAPAVPMEAVFPLQRMLDETLALYATLGARV